MTKSRKKDWAIRHLDILSASGRGGEVFDVPPCWRSYYIDKAAVQLQLSILYWIPAHRLVTVKINRTTTGQSLIGLSCCHVEHGPSFLFVTHHFKHYLLVYHFLLICIWYAYAFLYLRIYPYVSLCVRHSMGSMVFCMYDIHIAYFMRYPCRRVPLYQALCDWPYTPVSLW